jgi:hypothetical protein
LVYGLKDFLIPGAKRKIGKAALVSADALDEVVHFKYLDVKIADAGVVWYPVLSTIIAWICRML